MASNATAAGDEATEVGLVRLLERLQDAGYRFVTPNTGTVGLNRQRRGPAKRSLRDIFGWSLSFSPQDLPAAIFEDAAESKLLAPDGDLWKSRVRVSSVDEHLFAHSAYPPRGADAVFLGPDTYRFARFISACLRAPVAGAVLDIGTGAGVGAVLASRLCPGARVIATDVNADACRLARANAAAAGAHVEVIETPDLPPPPERFDLILANPPFISGRFGRTYRDGGDMDGSEISLRWALDGAERLRPGGRLIMYTGSAIRDGVDAFRAALEARALQRGLHLDYDEIDPDIFGGSLRQGHYQGVERIAAVGVVLSRDRGTPDHRF